MPSQAEIEAAARAMWDTWRVQPIAPDLYRDITWDWLIENSEHACARGYVDAGKAEARAALEAAERVRRPHG